MSLNTFIHDFTNNLSIKNKLRAISITTGLVILAVSSTVLIINEIVTVKRNMRADLLTLADIAGRNAAAGLTFESQSTVQDTLRSLSAKTNITCAHVFSPSGELFANYQRDDIHLPDTYTLQSRLPATVSVDSLQSLNQLHFFTSKELMVFKSIMLDGELLGIVSIESDLTELNQRLSWYFLVLFIDMLLSLLLALLLATGLQVMFTKPIYGLLTVINTVIGEKDYSLRAKHYGNDEIGRLINGFNEMLSAIDQRDEEINQLNQRLNSENRRMSSELDVTRQMQQMVLPSAQELASTSELDIAGFMQPADEVGGDYYDVLQEGEQIKIAVGDVTGHGLESGVIMLMVQTMVRTLLLAGIQDAKAFLSIVNRSLYANIQRMGSDKNLTLALLDYHAGELQVTGQHEQILVVRKDGSSEWLDTCDLGFMVGMEPEIDDMLDIAKIHLEPGDGIVLYTDGITEAHNVATRQKVYSEERLGQLISQHWSQPVTAICDEVLRDVLDYAGADNIFDDLTLLILKRR